MSGPFEGKDKVQHDVSDTDLNWSSPHHTLGKGPTQAARGNHTHVVADITDYVPGAAGTDLSLMAWEYDTNTVMADPGVGKVRADTPQWSPTNNFAISTTTNGGLNATPDLAALAVGDTIYFQEALHPENWGTYTVRLAPTAHATWYLVPVSVGELHGGALRAVAQEVEVRFMEGTAAPGVTDHGALTGLEDNDHPQYSMTDHVHSQVGGARLYYHDATAVGDPGTGRVSIESLGGQNRRFRVSKTDSQGSFFNLLPLAINDSVAYAGSGTNTIYARGYASSTVTDNGTYWTFDAVRESGVGSLPADGTLMTIVITMANGQGTATPLDHGALTGLSDNDHPQYALKQYVDELHWSTAVESTAVNWDTLETPGMYKKLMHGTSNPNGPGQPIYYYVEVYYYGSGSVTQFAIPYTGGSYVYTPAWRTRYTGTWTAWQHSATKTYVDSQDGAYLPLTGGNLSGNLAVSQASQAEIRADSSGSNAYLIADGPANAYRGMRFMTNNSIRWFLFASNSPAEDGTRAGSDLILYSYDDVGANGRQTFHFSRKTGLITLSTDVYFATQPSVAPGNSEVDASPAAPWAHMGGAYGNVKATRFGPLVCLQGMFSTNVSTAIAGWTTVGTLPAGWAPSAAVQGAGTWNGVNPIGTYVSTGGVIQVRAANANTTVSAAGTVSINLTWRA